ncbi:MAG: hypothetical protein J6V53_04485 [Alphaproteobacteria bacterium]|nr:hypothetical protein [Alphaproteobacteria bacterium]
MKIIHYLFLFFLFYLPFLCVAETNDHVSIDQSLQQLSLDLTKGIQTPLKKAEKIAVFIAEHYERDGFKKKEKDNAAKKNKTYTASYENNMQQTKVGDSYDFADLYQQMCSAIGLEVIIIEGYAGKNIESFSVKRKEQKAIKQASQMLSGRPDSSLERYKSAWNAVKIDDKWILVDTYWMIKGEKYAYKNIQSEKRMKRVLEQNKTKKLSKKNSSLDMDFFNAKPKNMIKTHYPFDESYQFLKKPYSFNKFLNR